MLFITSLGQDIELLGKPTNHNFFQKIVLVSF
jgi:hypothetical protein